MRCLVVAMLALAAQPALANGKDCGGDAYSSGVVVEHRPPRHGPLVAKPETLCADVEDVNRPKVNIDIYGTVPLGTDGAANGSAPYTGQDTGQGGRLPGRRPAPPYR